MDDIELIIDTPSTFEISPPEINHIIEAISPTVELERGTDTLIVKITDKNGEHVSFVNDGVSHTEIAEVEEEIAEINDVLNGQAEIDEDSLTGESEHYTGGVQANVGSQIAFSSSSAYHYEYYAVNPETDISFTVTTKQSTSANYPYFVHFVDANGVVLSVAGEIQSSEAYVTYTDVPVPQNAVRVYLTSLGGNDIVTTKKYYGELVPGLVGDMQTVKNHLNNMEGTVEEIVTNVGEPDYREKAIANANEVQGGLKGEAGGTLTATTTTGYHNVTVDVDDVAIEYTIKTKQSTSTNYPHYFWFLNSSNVILLAGGSVKTATGKYTYTTEVPEGAKKLVVLTADLAANIQITRKSLNSMHDKVDGMMGYFDKKGLSTSPYADELKDGGRATVFSHNFSSKLLNFAFITDTHFGGNRYPEYDARNNMKAFVDIANERWCDFAAHGGDIITDYGLTRDEAIKWMDDTLEIFGDIQIPLFIAKGNHEANNAYYAEVSDYTNLDWDNVTYYVRSGISFAEITQSDWDGEETLYVEDLSPQRIPDIQFSMLAQLGFAGDVERNSSDYMGGYFYRDFEREKIRVIVLDEYQIRGNNWVGMSAEQLAWLGGTALNLGTHTDYSVMVISHSQNIPADVLGLILAYKGGTSYTISGTTYSFTSQGEKPFIMYLHGHEHQDTLDTTSGINNVGVINGFVPSEKTETAEEIRFSVFSIDTANRKVYETRIGEGNNREFTY